MCFNHCIQCKQKLVPGWRKCKVYPMPCLNQSESSSVFDRNRRQICRQCRKANRPPYRRDVYMGAHQSQAPKFERDLIHRANTCKCHPRDIQVRPQRTFNGSSTHEIAAPRRIPDMSEPDRNPQELIMRSSDFPSSITGANLNIKRAGEPNAQGRCTRPTSPSIARQVEHRMIEPPKKHCHDLTLSYMSPSSSSKPVTSDNSITGSLDKMVFAQTRQLQPATPESYFPVPLAFPYSSSAMMYNGSITIPEKTFFDYNTLRHVELSRSDPVLMSPPSYYHPAATNNSNNFSDNNMIFAESYLRQAGQRYSYSPEILAPSSSNNTMTYNGMIPVTSKFTRAHGPPEDEEGRRSITSEDQRG